MRAPENAGTGVATAVATFAAWKEGRVAPATIELDVVPPRPDHEPRPVSPQVRARLRTDADEAIWTVAYSPDGTRLAAADVQAGTVHLWNPATGEKLVTVPTDSGFVDCVAFSPDGRTLVTSHNRLERRRTTEQGRAVQLLHYSGGIAFRDPATGDVERMFGRTSGRAVWRVGLTADGRLLAAGEMWSENDGRDFRSEVTLRDPQTGTVRRRLPVFGRAFCLSPDGRLLATADDAVQLWDTAAGDEIAQLPRPPKQVRPVNTLAFSPDGRLLAAADDLGNLLVWDVAGRAIHSSAKYGDGRTRISGLAFLPDGRTLAGVADDAFWRSRQGEWDGRCHSQVVLWDVETMTMVRELIAPSRPLVSLAVSPDGGTLATGGMGEVLLWSLEDEARHP